MIPKNEAFKVLRDNGYVVNKKESDKLDSSESYPNQLFSDICMLSDKINSLGLKGAWLKKGIEEYDIYHNQFKPLIDKYKSNYNSSPYASLKDILSNFLNNNSLANNYHDLPPIIVPLPELEF